MSQVNTKPNIPSWEAESLRLTLFPSPYILPIEEPSEDWWTEIVGGSPDTVVVQPKQGIRRAEGRFENGKLVLQIEPTRIDWVFAQSSADSSGFPFWASQGFYQAMSRWFRTAPTAVRLAFGAVLGIRVDNREAGYNLLGHFLPNIQLDPTNSSDFLYQINRPRQVEVGGTNLTINRVSKWSVALSEVRQLHPHDTVLFKKFACRLELDISTPQDLLNEFRNEQSSRIFETLVDLGREIAKEGDKV